MIIGITGKKRAGKDTAGDILVSILGGAKVAYANPMKETASNLFGWSRQHIEDYKEEVDPEWGISPRQFLQVLGTEFMQLMLSEKFPLYAETTGRSFWAKRLLKLAKDRPLFITDVRFPHEIKELKEHQKETGEMVFIIRIHRNVCDGVQDLHASEQEMEAIPANQVFENNGTKEDLYIAIKTWLDEIGIIPKNKIYIAGPITGMPNNNWENFNNAYQTLLADGYQPYSPLDISKVAVGKKWEDYMRECLPVLLKCDRVYMLRGWQSSKGATLEHTLALSLQMGIIYE